MCLSKAHRFPRISWKPIKCYKLVYEENGKLCTPFQGVEIILNEPIKSSKNLFDFLSCNVVNGEGVHAFITIERAFTMRYYMSVSYPYPLICKVYEAIIPPFTFYWEGESNDIAARKLIVIKEVPL